MSKSLYLLMILSFMVTLGGCNDDEGISVPNHAPTYSVKMGGIFPFTGGLSEKGKPRHQAALLAVEHLTEAGFSVGWVVADSETNPETGVKVARELVEKGGAKIIIGAASSGVTTAIVENVSLPNQIPQISYASTSYKITTLERDLGYGDSDFLFRTVPSDTLQSIVLAQLAFDSHYRSLSVLYVDNSYGRSLSKIFKEHFESLGGTVITVVPHDEVVTSEVEGGESYLEQLQRAYAVDAEALVAISYFRHVKIYIQEAKDNDLFHKFIFVGGSKSKELVETIKPNGSLEGMCGTAPGVDYSKNSYKTFKKEYETEYTDAPEIWDKPNVYDAVVLAGLAAYAAQAIGESITPITIREYLRRVNAPDGQKVIAGPESLKRAMKILDSGVTINYEGASGNVDFDENGDVFSPIEIWCFEGGEIVHKKNVQPDV